MDVKLPILPKGYCWVADPKIRVVVPFGWRVEKVRRRRIGVGQAGTRVRRETTMAWLSRYEEFEKVVVSGGEVGGFYEWGGGNYPPRAIGRMLLGDRRWLWLPTYGGLIRLADEPTEVHSKPVSRFGPGEFFLSDERCRMPGFSCFPHDGWGKRVNVRLPAGLETLMDKAARKRIGVEGGGE